MQALAYVSVEVGGGRYRVSMFGIRVGYSVCTDYPLRVFFRIPVAGWD